MAVSKAQQNAVNKYMATHYDRINLTLPKGQKAVLQAHTAALGESVNGFIGRIIAEAIRQETQAADLAVPPETLETARRAAEAAGESVSDFVARAIEMQVQRDSAALRLGIDPMENEQENCG